MYLCLPEFFLIQEALHQETKVRVGADSPDKSYRIIRGSKGKVSIRTFGYRGLRVVLTQTAGATANYLAYREVTTYVNGRQR